MRHEDGMRVLQQGVERVPASAAIHYALGLAKVRKGESDGAFTHLRKAAELDPENLRFKYVLAIALNSHGFWPNALKVLKCGEPRHEHQACSQARSRFRTPAAPRHPGSGSSINLIGMRSCCGELGSKQGNTSR